MLGLRLGEQGSERSAEINMSLSESLQKKLLQGSSDLDQASQSDEEPSSIDIDDINESELDCSAEELESSTIFEGDNTPSLSRRRWTKTDRMDLTRLGSMISSFLEEPRFAADSKLFQTHVIAPLMDSSGPRFGSVQVVMQVMQSVMIRHRCVPH